MNDGPQRIGARARQLPLVGFLKNEITKDAIPHVGLTSCSIPRPEETCRYNGDFLLAVDGLDRTRHWN